MKTKIWVKLKMRFILCFKNLITTAAVYLFKIDV